MSPIAFRHSLPIALAAIMGLAACQDPSLAPQEPTPIPQGEKLKDAEIERLFIEAQQKFMEGDFDQAGQNYRAILFSKKSAKAWHALGDVHMATMEFAEAARDFQRALELEPEKRMSQVRLGQALVRAGKFDQAAEAYRKAQALAPDAPDAYRLEGAALTASSLYEEALAAYAKAAEREKDPAKKSEDFNSMGELALGKKEYQRACGYLDQAAQSSPTVERFAALAEARLKMADLKGTRDAYVQAAKLEKKDPFYWEVVGELEMKLGDRKAAREAFTSSLALEERATIHGRLAKMDLEDKDVAAAKARLDKMLAITEGASQDVQAAARLAALLGDWTMSEKLLLTMNGAPDVPDQTGLWLEIAAVRSAGGNRVGVSDACTMVKAKFEESLTPAQKKALHGPQTPPQASAAEQGAAIPEKPTVEDGAAAKQRCDEAIRASREKKGMDDALNNQAAELCQKSLMIQEILLKTGMPSAPAAAEGKDGAAEETARSEERQAPSVSIPQMPVCPPEKNPWEG